MPHGFRKSFKTWTMEEKTATRAESEAALAHKLGADETEDAYIDTELLEPRRPVMQQWADFLNGANSRMSG